MCVSLRNDRNINNDNRLSKFNFILQNNYLIKSTLLEKRLLHKTSKCNDEPIVHLLLNLEACSNR